jgi:putative ABC transport system permease protein
MLLAVTGIAVGAIAALLLGRLITSLLYGVSAADPLTLGANALVLAAAALLACYVPARRATRVDPMDALRSE